MLKNCCLCISLKTGCYIIAAIYIVSQIRGIFDSLAVLDVLEEEENEDEENKQQRKTVETGCYVLIFIAVFKILVGLAILYATIMEVPTLLKVCACVMVVGTLVPFLMAAMNGVGRSSQSYVVEAFFFVICLYGACVLWSHADEVENPELPMNVYVLPQPFPRF